MEADYLNVRAAFEHADGRTKARVCLGLWRYWRNGAHIGEGRDWLALVLAAPDELGDDVRARLLHGAAILAATQDEHETAYGFAVDSLGRATAAGDRATIGHAHNALGIAAIGGGDHEAAVAHFEQSLVVWRELGVPPGVAAALGNLSKVSLSRGELAAAERYAGECLDLERANGNTRGILLALECRGQIMLARGDVAAARAALGESLALSRQIGDAFGAAMAQHQLGLAARADGDPAEALRLLVAALVTRHEVGDRLDLAISLDVVAALLAPDDPAHAARLVGAADNLRAKHRLTEPPDEQTLRSATLPMLSAYPRDRAAGRAASLDHIVATLKDLGSSV
ncbi:tetratricopeptide repeat protein [Dactylosporangium sucinum]|uniref:tetratricopeptide repeat protein n=1 Tax=Dactylosporangium sucinum TaxID=1424081 RepID=UPI00167E58B7